MANPPPQDDDPLPSKPPTKKTPAQLAKKLRTRIDELKLKFPAVPTLTGTPDQLAELGQAAGSATVDFDQVKSLNLAQKLFLLEKANLTPSLEAAAAASAPASGSMPALVLTDGTLALSHYQGVRFDKVEFRSPPIAAVYSAGTSYSEFESKLQRQCVTASTAAVGMPGIFQVDASYNTASSRATHDQKISVGRPTSRPRALPGRGSPRSSRGGGPCRSACAASWTRVPSQTALSVAAECRQSASYAISCLKKPSFCETRPPHGPPPTGPSRGAPRGSQR
jgi:hypothetical protein